MWAVGTNLEVLSAGGAGKERVSLRPTIHLLIFLAPGEKER